jgi:hypothetical protein
MIQKMMDFNFFELAPASVSFPGRFGISTESRMLLILLEGVEKSESVGVTKQKIGEVNTHHTAEVVDLRYRAPPCKTAQRPADFAVQSTTYCSFVSLHTCQDEIIYKCRFSPEMRCSLMHPSLTSN